MREVNPALSLGLWLPWKAVGSESPALVSSAAASDRVACPLRRGNFRLLAQNGPRSLARPAQVHPRRLGGTRPASAARCFAVDSCGGDRVVAARGGTVAGTARSTDAGDLRTGGGDAARLHGRCLGASGGEAAAAADRLATGDLQLDHLTRLQSDTNAVRDTIRGSTGRASAGPDHAFAPSRPVFARLAPRPHPRSDSSNCPTVPPARTNAHRIARQRPCWPVGRPINEVATRTRFTPSSTSQTP